MNNSPADPQKGCLAQVEASLEPIYRALLPVAGTKADDGGLARMQRAVEQFLDGVTCSPGCGYERGKLLRPEWRETWRQQREFSDAALCDLLDPIHMLHSAERHVGPDEKFLNEEEWSYLREVFQKMISFVVDDLSVNPWIPGELRTVLWRYLSLRGHDVPASVAELPGLSERQYLVLQAMLELDAVSGDKRRTTAELGIKAEGLAANSGQFKDAIADLKHRHLIETKEGRNGGCWLTVAGRALAEQL